MKKILALILGMAVGLSSVVGFAENAEVDNAQVMGIEASADTEPSEGAAEIGVEGVTEAEPIIEAVEETPGSSNDDYICDEVYDEGAVILYAASTVYNNYVGEELIDEFDNMDYLYSSENIEIADSNSYPMVKEGYGDTSTLWLSTVNIGANIVYCAEEGKTFKKVFFEVSGNVNKSYFSWPAIEYSYDGNTWLTLVASFEGWDPDKNGWMKTQNANDANAWQKAGYVEKDVPKGAKYVRASLTANSNAKPSKDSFLFRKAKLEVEKIGEVATGSYNESFSSLNYTDKCDGITAENGGFTAAADAVLSYKAARGKAFNSFSVTAKGLNSNDSLSVTAVDCSGRRIDITEDLTVVENSDSITLSGNLDAWVKSIELKNTDAAMYTALSLGTVVATGSDWLYLKDDVSFTESGNTFGAQVTVGNDAGTAQNVGAYLVVYNDGVPVKVVKDVKSIVSGGYEKLVPMVEKSFLTDNAYAILYVMTDIKTGVLIGDKAVYKSENVKAENAVEAEMVTDNTPQYYVSDIDNAVIDVYGKMPYDERNKKVVLTVLNPGYTADNAESAEANMAINNILSTEIDENGLYTAAIRLRNANTASYKLLVNSAAHSALASNDISYRRVEDMNDVWTAIANAMKTGNRTALEAQLTKSVWKMLGVRSAELENITAADVCNMIAATPVSEVEETPNGIKYAIEGKKLLDMLKKGNMTALIKRAVSDEIAMDIVSGGNADTVPFMMFKASADNVVDAVVSALNGKTYQNPAKFRDAFAAAILSATIDKAQTVVAVRKAMEDFSTLFTIDYSQVYASLDSTNRAKAETELQNSVKAKALESVNDAAERFLTCCRNVANSTVGVIVGGGSGSGGSGGGGRFGASNVSVAVSPDIVNSVANSNTSTGKEPFIDIADVPWAQESILALEKQGIISGREKMKFEPNSNVTREEFVKMLVGALKISSDNAGCSFDDVTDDDWFSDSIAEACGAGIVNGMTAQFFGVGVEITREEMATMTYRAMSFCGVELEAAIPSFSDNALISEYAYSAVAALCNGGIISGKGSGRFEPQAFATRAEAAKVIYLTMKLCNK